MLLYFRFRIGDKNGVEIYSVYCFGHKRSDSNEIPNADATASESATNPPKMKQKFEHAFEEK